MVFKARQGGTGRVRSGRVGSQPGGGVVGGADLSINFTASPSLGSLMTVTRAGTATVQDANGIVSTVSANTPRVSSRGLLIEPSSQNLWPQSEFATGWGAQRATIVTGILAPDNSTNAIFLQEDSTAANSHNISVSGPARTAGVATFTLSFFSRRAVTGAARDMGVFLWDSAFAKQLALVWNLDNGMNQWNGTTFTQVNRGAEPAGNGYWRCWATFTTDATTTGWFLEFILTDAHANPAAWNATNSYNGDGASGAYLWGVMLEPNPVMTSYIPTTTVAVTRAADAITLTGTAATLLNAATGSAFVETEYGGKDGTADLISSNGTTLLGFNSSNQLVTSITSSTTTANVGTRIRAKDRAAVTWNASGRILALNNGANVTDAVAQTPSATLYLGSNGAGANVFSGYIRSLNLWATKRLTPTVDFALENRNVLNGVDIAGAENSTPSWPISGDWTYLASKGVTFVRLAISWEGLQPTLSAALNSTYLANLTAAVAAASAQGIKVIIDIHNYAHYALPAAWGTTVVTAGNGGGTAANVAVLGDATLTQATFVDLWTRLATAFVGNAGVKGYGIMNEPTNIGSSTAWPLAAQAAVDTIRTIDTSTPIYVCGDATVNAASFDAAFYQPTPITGTFIVNEAHHYPDYNPATTTPGGSGKYTGTYTSYGINNYISGVQGLITWVGWLKQKGYQGWLGEINVPNNVTDANAQWLNVISGCEEFLVQQGIPVSMYFYGANNAGSGDAIQINPQAGVDDPRFKQLMGI
jgi:hypothetical protein